VLSKNLGDLEKKYLKPFGYLILLLLLLTRFKYVCTTQLNKNITMFISAMIIKRNAHLQSYNVSILAYTACFRKMYKSVTTRYGRR
jgi:hypothetical protein